MIFRMRPVLNCADDEVVFRFQLQVMLTLPADSDPARLGGDKSPVFQVFLMTTEDLCRHGTLMDGPKINEPKDPGMRRTTPYNKLAKVFVECYKNPLFLIRQIEKNGVAGVFWEFPCPDHIMSLRFQFNFCLGAEAGIQQDFQEPTSIVRGSMRSLAAMRRA